MARPDSPAFGKMGMHIPQASEADIVLLLEGTYPYVSGGVSGWVHQLIQAFPDYRFGLIFIGGRPDHYGEMRYVLPEQVVHLERHYVHDSRRHPPVRSMPGHPQVFHFMKELHEWMRQGEACPYGGELVTRMMSLVCRHPRALESEFLYSEEAWNYLTDVYAKHCTDPSFVDFFWTVRQMHEPIWMLGRVAARCMKAKVFHTVSTGYAGFLGALLHHHTGCPLILSEHGIYTKERKIDLFQFSWLKDNRLSFEKGGQHFGYFQHLWVRFFETLGRLCYEAADPIVSLFEASRQRQILDGADPARTVTIPNGIPVERFAPLRAERPATPPPVLCLIGRVVPIKDVKTFIRAMRTVINRVPDAEAWIAGPEDEDPQYAQECRQLADNLGMGTQVKFLGFQRIDELFPRMGLLILSSISEALPLVVLEAFAAGVPVVTTDVGACRELIEGKASDGDGLGPAGAVVPMANPQALADAAVALLEHPAQWKAAQEAGIQRVEAFYTQSLMIERYQQLYERALDTWQVSALSCAKS